MSLLDFFEGRREVEGFRLLCEVWRATSSQQRRYLNCYGFSFTVRNSGFFVLFLILFLLSCARRSQAFKRDAQTPG